MNSEEKREILEQFVRLQGMMHRYQAQTFMSFGPWGNPHRGQGRVLSILKMKPEISQKELTYLLGMSKQALAELLNKLEQRGYIKRELSEEDRRSYIVKLTEEGAAAAEDMVDTAPELDEVFDSLSDEELKNLSDYLKRLTEKLSEKLGGDDEDWRRQAMRRFMEHGGPGFGGHGHPFGGHGPEGFNGRGHHGCCGKFGGIW